MPRFYINVDYVSSRSEDEDGEVFANAAAALEEARIVMKELLIEAIRSETSSTPQQVHVLDDRKCQIGAVRVSDILSNCS